MLWLHAICSSCCTFGRFFLFVCFFCQCHWQIRFACIAADWFLSLFVFVCLTQHLTQNYIHKRCADWPQIFNYTLRIQNNNVTMETMGQQFKSEETCAHKQNGMGGVGWGGKTEQFNSSLHLFCLEPSFKFSCFNEWWIPSQRFEVYKNRMHCNV